MIHQTPPENFNPQFEAVGCFLEYEQTFPLLLRQDHKRQPNTWGIPSGKKETQETLQEAMLREVREETAIVLHPSQLKHIAKLYIRFDEYDFIYQVYATTLTKKPEIKINPEEHKEVRWVTPQQAKMLPLIQDLDACMEIYFTKE